MKQPSVAYPLAKQMYEILRGATPWVDESQLHALGITRNPIPDSPYGSVSIETISDDSMGVRMTESLVASSTGKIALVTEEKWGGACQMIVPEYAERAEEERALSKLMGSNLMHALLHVAYEAQRTERSA